MIGIVLIIIWTDISYTTDNNEYYMTNITDQNNNLQLISYTRLSEWEMTIPNKDLNPTKNPVSY